MEKIRIFSINFAEPHNAMPVFFGGQVVSGVVTIELAEPMKMRCINIDCKGQATVKFVIQAGNHTQFNHNYEAYVDKSTVLLARPNAQGLTEELVLPQGCHQYPFSFTLPAELPPSFEGMHGCIRYSIIATIPTRWGKFDHFTIRPFTVISHLDLNSRPELRVGLGNSDDTTICCLCCASGPISAEFQTSRAGFVPGEKIFMSGVVKNNSRRSIKSVTFQLRQEVGFRGPGGAGIPTTRTLLELGFEGPQPGETRRYSDVKMEVPPLPPSGLPWCKIIEVVYVLTMVVKPSGPAEDLTVPLIITIGTIPLLDSYQFYMQHMGVSNPSTPALGASATPPPAPALPPPSYAELFEKWTVMDNAQDTEDNTQTYRHGSADWTPRYTYYNFPRPSDTVTEGTQ